MMPIISGYIHHAVINHGNYQMIWNLEVLYTPDYHMRVLLFWSNLLDNSWLICRMILYSISRISLTISNRESKLRYLVWILRTWSLSWTEKEILEVMSSVNQYARDILKSKITTTWWYYTNLVMRQVNLLCHMKSLSRIQEEWLISIATG
jgi:hypothetical protein